MKKTVTVNLDKTIFNIDDDAYTVLESYLEALHDHFKKEEGGQEIMNDIESRISELFKERLGFGMQVITLQEVNEVIAIMGQPDEIDSLGNWTLLSEKTKVRKSKMQRGTSLP